MTRMARWIVTLFVLSGSLAGCGGAAPVQRHASNDVVDSSAAMMHAGSSVRRGVLLTAAASEPVVRVRVGRALERVELHAAGGLWLTGGGDGHRLAVEAPPVTVWRERGGAGVVEDEAYFIRDAKGETLRWATPTLEVSRRGEAGDVMLDGRAYPGTLVLRPAAGDAVGAVAMAVAVAGRLDVVNHVGLEAYLPGVLERELYASWPAATFEAQAVAARSYAIWERALQASRDPSAGGRGWDLESDVASQAYIGTATNPKAVDAVRRTRGVVLAYDGRVLPAFYSSTCGGRGQDAAAVFADRVDDLPPLRGVPRERCCEASKKYRWRGERDAATLATRLAAWGRVNRHPVGAMRGLSAVRIAVRNGAGRPTGYAVTDGSGRVFTLDAEQFRFACNFDGGDAGSKLEASMKLLSGDVEPRIDAGRVIFDEGRGYGHGVGMCQWGARGRALAGERYSQILAAYYGRASLMRAYR